MLKTIFIIVTMFSTAFIVAQEETKLEIKFDWSNDSRVAIMERFEGIEKADVTFTNTQDLIGKNYIIEIEEYRDGNQVMEKQIINTKKEGLPPIGKDFKLSTVFQHRINHAKIGFLTSRFSNVQSFLIDEKFKDGDFSLRDVCGTTETLDYKEGERMQLFLITPPNQDPSKGNLGYCEVSQGGIEVESWYKKYEIPQFFLVYLTVVPEENSN